MLATRTFASSVVENHGSANAILDEKELGFLRAFVEGVGGEFLLVCFLGGRGVVGEDGRRGREGGDGGMGEVLGRRGTGGKEDGGGDGRVG